MGDQYLVPCQIWLNNKKFDAGFTPVVINRGDSLGYKVELWNDCNYAQTAVVGVSFEKDGNTGNYTDCRWFTYDMAAWEAIIINITPCITNTSSFDLGKHDFILATWQNYTPGTIIGYIGSKGVIYKEGTGSLGGNVYNLKFFGDASYSLEVKTGGTNYWDLDINSYPSPMEFYIGNNKLNTPYSATNLSQGNYQIVFYPTYIWGGKNWKFSKWEDNSTNPNRTINLNKDMSLMATYVEDTSTICAEYKTKAECEAAKCYWYNDVCNGLPQDFWERWKWYIIGGGGALFLLIAIWLATKK